MNKKVLLSSLMSIAMLASIASGATYALFTAEDTANIAVTAGKVAVEASVDQASLKTYSMDVEQAYGTFENGGSAEFDVDTNDLALKLMTPGDAAEFKVIATNNSNVKIKYRTSLAINGELAPALTSKVVIDGTEYDVNGGKTSWIALDAGEDIPDIDIRIDFLDAENNNDYQEKEAKISVKLEAAQGNADLADKWDGSTDTTWYDANETIFTLNQASQVAGLADLVDSGETFEGKTIKLDSDLNLETYDENGNRVSFDPIGYGYDVVFKGTFDGQGHTISNLYQDGWALGLEYSTEGGGLFASVVDASFKNLNIDNSKVVMECIDMGTLVGYSYGTCSYENIKISNSTIANYQRYTGGVVGEINGNHTFKNVDVVDSTVSSLWGDFDCSVGGIIGGKWGTATVVMEDCDVDCVINTYNDITSSYQWHAYRRAGMLIGNSEETKTVDGRTEATATYLTTKNCTVTYREWANYTYCEFAGQNWPYVRVQGSEFSDPYSNPRYGVATDANGNKVVDENHVHNDGEDHHILIVFDQLYGGGQGVYGGQTHEGVKITYYNK